eukprot:6173266-Prymnesium_polylepis.1
MVKCSRKTLDGISRSLSLGAAHLARAERAARRDESAPDQRHACVHRLAHRDAPRGDRSGRAALQGRGAREQGKMPPNRAAGAGAAPRHSRTAPSRAEPHVAASQVEFLSQAEWDKELPDLLDDLTPTDGANVGRVSIGEVQPDNPSYASWCRLYAVYGDVFKNSRERTDEKGERARSHRAAPTPVAAAHGRGCAAALCRRQSEHAHMSKHVRVCSGARSAGPDGRPLYKNPTLEALTAKLRSTRNITHALGT